MIRLALIRVIPYKVADHVVMMDCYSARDVTDQAKVSERRIIAGVLFCELTIL